MRNLSNALYIINFYNYWLYWLGTHLSWTTGLFYYWQLAELFYPIFSPCRPQFSTALLCLSFWFRICNQKQNVQFFRLGGMWLGTTASKLRWSVITIWRRRFPSYPHDHNDTVVSSLVISNCNTIIITMGDWAKAVSALRKSKVKTGAAESLGEYSKLGVKEIICNWGSGNTVTWNVHDTQYYAPPNASLGRYEVRIEWLA